MCGDPLTMALLTVAQGVVSYTSQKQQADAQAAMYNAQAEQNAMNARIKEQESAQTSQEYAQKEREINNRAKLIAARNRAEAGGSGLDMFGSVMDVNTGVLEGSAFDKQINLQNQRNATKALEVDQVNYLNSAEQNRTAAYNTRQQARNQLVPTILGTALQIGGIYNKYGGTSSGTTDNGYYAPAGTSVNGKWTIGKTTNWVDSRGLMQWNTKGW